MRHLRSKLLIPIACAILCVANLAAQSGTSPSAPDNSKQNQTQSPTADNQTNAQADRTTTAKVRKAIVADKDLSTYAHNIKIVTINGAVTLKGPVKSEEEKQKIASDVASVIPSDKLTNDLTVKP
jgi:hyperosmotically inducible periplasmic protein